jgi:hypothetical protein
VETQSVSFDPTTGNYLPDPFVVRARVTNTASGSLGWWRRRSRRRVCTWSRRRTFLWRARWRGRDVGGCDLAVRPISRQTGDSLRIPVTFTDRFGNVTSCEVKVWIPGAPEPGLVLACSTELDSLVVDRLRGAYAQGTFVIRAQVGNTSGRTVYDVKWWRSRWTRSAHLDLVAEPGGGGAAIGSQRAGGGRGMAGECDSALEVGLDPGAVPGLGQGRAGPFGADEECSVWIHVPEVGRPNLECDVWTSVTTRTGQQPEDRMISYSEALAITKAGVDARQVHGVRGAAKVRNNGEGRRTACARRCCCRRTWRSNTRRMRSSTLIRATSRRRRKRK